MKWVRFYFKEIVDRIGRWIAGVNLSWENIWTELYLYHQKVVSSFNRSSSQIIDIYFDCFFLLLIQIQ